MKIQVTITPEPGAWSDTITLLPEENENLLPRHWRVQQKAIRLVNAINRSGARADFLIQPESAAELNRICDQGRFVARRLRDTSLIKNSKAKSAAIKRWRNLTTNTI